MFVSTAGAAFFRLSSSSVIWGDEHQNGRERERNKVIPEKWYVTFDTVVLLSIGYVQYQSSLQLFLIFIYKDVKQVEQELHFPGYLFPL